MRLICSVMLEPTGVHHSLCLVGASSVFVEWAASTAVSLVIMAPNDAMDPILWIANLELKPLQGSLHVGKVDMRTPTAL